MSRNISLELFEEVLWALLEYTLTVFQRDFNLNILSEF